MKNDKPTRNDYIRQVAIAALAPIAVTAYYQVANAQIPALSITDNFTINDWSAVCISDAGATRYECTVAQEMPNKSVIHFHFKKRFVDVQVFNCDNNQLTEKGVIERSASERENGWQVLELARNMVAQCRPDLVESGVINSSFIYLMLYSTN